MKLDDIGVTKICKKFRECTLCARQYSISTSISVLYTHVFQHKELHDLLRKKLGEKKFQERLNHLPKSFKLKNNFDDQTLEKTINASKNSIVTCSAYSRKRKTEDNSAYEILKNFDSTVSEVKTKQGKSNESLALHDSSNKHSQEVYFKKLSNKSKKTNFNTVNYAAEKTSKSKKMSKKGYGSLFKTDVLGLTKIISPNHRICLGCDKKFKTTCSVTTLYKHCIKHSEHRHILKNNLAESVYNNALKNANIFDTEENVGNEHKNSINDKKDLSLSVDKSLNELLEKAKKFDCLNKSNSSVVDEYSTDNNLESKNNRLKCPGIKLPEVLKSPIIDKRIVDCSNDNFEMSQDKFFQICGLPKKSIDKNEIEKFFSFFNSENFRIIVKKFVSNNEFIKYMDNGYCEMIEINALSLEEYSRDKTTVAVIKAFFLDSSSIMRFQNFGIVSFDNGISVLDLEKTYIQIYNILSKYKQFLNEKLFLISNGSLFSKFFSIRKNVVEIPCLLTEIVCCLTSVQSKSVKIFDCLKKAAKKFSLYKFVVDNEIEISSKLKEIGGIETPTHWINIYNILAFGAFNIIEATFFCQEFWPSLVLSNEELVVVYKFLKVNQPIVKILNILTSGLLNMTNYLEIVFDIYELYENYEVVSIESDITEVLLYTNAIQIENVEKFSEFVASEVFYIPPKSVNTNISNDSVDKFFNQMIINLKKCFLELKNKSKENHYICKGLLLNTKEAYNLRYGDNTFWSFIESLFDPQFEISNYSLMQEKVSFNFGMINDVQLYRNILYRCEANYLGNFWPSQQHVLPVLYKEYTKALSIPILQNKSDNVDALFEWVKHSSNFEDNYRSNMVHEIKNNISHEILDSK